MLLHYRMFLTEYINVMFCIIGSSGMKFECQGKQMTLTQHPVYSRQSLV